MSVVESTLPLRQCKMCNVTKNRTELLNIMEVGPEKEDISHFINIFYRILQVRKVAYSGDLLCLNCLKPFVRYLRKGKLLFESHDKMQQVKYLSQTALSESRSNNNLHIESDFDPIAESSLEEQIAGPSGASSAGSSRSPITDFLLEQIAGPSGTSNAGSSRSPITDSLLELIAGPSEISSADSYNTPITDSSLEQIAGPSGVSSADSYNTPITDSSLEQIAGPSGTSSAGSYKTPITDSLSEQIAGPSGTSNAGSYKTPITVSLSEQIPGPSGTSNAGSYKTPITVSLSEQIAGPSGTSNAGSYKTPITDSLSEQIPGPSLHSEPFRATIAKPSINSSLKRFSNPDTDVVVNQKKRKTRNFNNTCPFCHSQDVNNRDFQFDSTTKLCSRHSQPYTCLLKDCKIVFPNRDVFIPHYRSHLKLTKQTYLCRTCFAVLGCSRNVKRDSHKHQDKSKLYCCCSDTFLSMTDFVFHKLLNHSLEVTVIMRHGQMKEYSNGDRPLNPLYATTMTKNTQCKQTSIQLFTCTVEYCGRVFDTVSANVEHFREHAKIPVTCSVCSICLLQSNIPDFQLKCNHINSQIACKICNCGFETLHELALHKFTNHLSVILCGPDKVQGCTVCGIIFKRYENPFDHYISKCFSYEDWDLKSNKSEKNEQSFDSVTKQSFHANFKFGGSYICIDCGVNFYSLNLYLAHVKKHGQAYHSRDLYNIILCPICDKNYDRSGFLNHLVSCTRGMQLTENTFGCAQCRKRLLISEPWRFRVHYLFCKSFETINDDSDKPCYKCLNCTFKSNNLLLCLGHSSAICIYFRLKMRYSMSMDEVKKVENRKKEIFKYSQIDLKPQNEYKHFFNPKCCNRNRQKLLDSFEYYCMFCKKGFYSDLIFKQHLNVHGYSCRPLNIVYCRYCVCDFDSIDHFTSHASGMSIDLPIEPTIHRPIKCEEIDDENLTTDLEISTGDVQIPTEDVKIPTGDVQMSTGDVQMSTGDVQISTGEEEKVSRKKNRVKSGNGIVEYTLEEEEEITIDEDQKPDLSRLNCDSD
ncbi:Hypothetical protein CINCED_3A024603 [Cinara cedri]|uniref:C2H2-type domain-containing protein n=1 Tax=Cinara cedri TaxID=506608 RepID=A0A5E4NJP6_9HEMI|nr:Hypothetical protein CINCED_3A024603 [Cinara cedri]